MTQDPTCTCSWFAMFDIGQELTIEFCYSNQIKMMNDDLNDELRALRDEGKSKDEILDFLFKKGLSITDAIVAIRALYGIRLQEAKEMVSQNIHWQDIHKNHQPLHDAAEAILEKLARRRPPRL